MKNYSLILSILTFSLLQLACSFEPKEEKKEPLSEREQLYQEVKEIHDAVMPKMADINRVKRKFSDLLEADSMMVDDKKLLINSNIEALVRAENLMMDWMKAFKIPKAGDPDSQAIEYLNNEKANISLVSDQMLNSLKKGEELLTQLEKGQNVY